MKKIMLATCGLLAGALLGACGTPSDSGGAGDSGTTIKIALIPPTSGALATFGSDAVRGWELAVEQVNAAGGINGRQVELVVKSTDAKPETTLRVAREAVTNDGATFIGAVMTSTEHSALNAQLAGIGALSINSLGKDDSLTGKDCAANAFRVSQSTTMDVNALAQSFKDLPGDRWAIQAVDYSTGHTAAEIFTAAAEKAGKQVVLTQFAPLNTTDFGSYITKLDSSGADALFAAEFGADGVAFVKQAGQFNLTESFRTVLGFNMVSEPLFKPLGDGIVGFYNNVGYDAANSNALNSGFVAAYEKKYGQAPYYIPADAYLGAQTLFAAITKAGSTDLAQVSAALEDLSFDSIVGPVTMRGADHQLLRPSYLGVVEGSGDNLKFRILSTVSPELTTPAANPACKI